nr:hypothetical protein [Pyrinomonadaceae bacterium]
MKTQEIADFLSAELVGDGNIEISSVADLHKAAAGQIAFLEKGKEIGDSDAACIIVPIGFDPGAHDAALIFSANPKLAFALIAP